ncbi:MAG: Ppx/GppA family phosphatase [Gammaproteobacteria bacterium]|nr:Ppx/GppA family phosphatase [Gammaproteobacteria bacterium]
MYERYAAVDLGSNSFHLLLAEFRDQRMVRLHTDRALVRLAEGLDAQRNLKPDSIQAALLALRRFQPVLSSIPADHIRVVGTNTLRIANNTDNFLEAAEQLLGAPIEIINGIEEARLIFSGVMTATNGSSQHNCVIDIGGGSTELARGKKTPEILHSLFMGCISFSQRFFSEGKLSASNFERARRAASSELQGLRHLAHNARVIGASGTIKAIARILNAGELGDIEWGALNQLALQVAACKQAKELQLPGLEWERLPVFAAGLAILHSIFSELNIARMQISPCAIREGIVHDLAGRLHGGDRRADTVAMLVSRWDINRAQAKRVGDTADQLFCQVCPKSNSTEQQLLHWAADLHEIGLALSHSGFRKLGSYIITHADLAGFSRSTQENLAYLIHNQRGNIKPPREHYGFHPRPELLLCLRIACIVHRDQSDRQLNGMVLKVEDASDALENPLNTRRFTLEATRGWLDKHPAIEDLLLQEVHFWQRQSTPLQLRSV